MSGVPWRGTHLPSVCHQIPWFWDPQGQLVCVRCFGFEIHRATYFVSDALIFEIHKATYFVSDALILRSTRTRPLNLCQLFWFWDPQGQGHLFCVRYFDFEIHKATYFVSDTLILRPTKPLILCIKAALLSKAFFPEGVGAPSRRWVPVLWIGWSCWTRACNSQILK